MLKEHAPVSPEFTTLRRHGPAIILRETHNKPNKHHLRMICRAAAGLLIFATANNAEFSSPISDQPGTKIVEAATAQQLPMNVASAIQSIDHTLTER